MKIKITFTEPVLGTISGNPEVFQDFIGSKHPDGIDPDEKRAAEELSEAIEKTMTGFARTEDGKPMMWDYQVKGFFKEACEAMIHSEKYTKELLKKVRLTQYLYKKTIDGQIFVGPRQILLDMSGPMIKCERPLRGQTMRGERISLACSEEAPAGTKIEVDITCCNAKLGPFVEEWLDYAVLKGFGQWRNSGKGRATWKKL